MQRLGRCSFGSVYPPPPLANTAGVSEPGKVWLPQLLEPWNLAVPFSGCPVPSSIFGDLGLGLGAMMLRQRAKRLVVTKHMLCFARTACVFARVNRALTTPLSEPQEVRFPSNVGTLLRLSQRGRGGGG